jgi:hypothetical protein
MGRWIPGLWAGLLALGTIVIEVAACSASKTSTFTNPETGGDDAGAPAADAGGGGQPGDDAALFGDAGTPCVNLQCQQVNCGAGGDTVVSGTVFAPNGTLPIYNAIVYVPNAPLDPLTKGITCDRCGSVSSGNPIVSALTDAKGHFELHNAPSGANIPLVIQLGKWRRETTIPSVAQCTETKLTDPNLTRLPKNQKEGSMPHIALTTGFCDQVGCMLPKLGIDPSEFGFQGDGFNKAINLYAGDDQGAFSSGNAPITPADNLWGDFKQLENYDMAIFSCECSEALDSKGNGYTAHEFAEVRKYLDNGGRIFTTDFQYTWYKYSPDPGMGGGNPNGPNAGIGQIPGGAPDGFDPVTLDTSFPKGKALADWLAFVFASGDAGAGYGQVSADYVFANIDSLVASATQTWANSAAGQLGTAGPRVFTVNTPVGKPVDQQCGKGVHLDAHITQPPGFGSASTDLVGCNGSTCYPATCNDPFKEDEAMFAFFFFDLSSCIQNDSQPPTPPR